MASVVFAGGPLADGDKERDERPLRRKRKREFGKVRSRKMRRAAIGLLAAVFLLHGCGGGDPDCAQAPDFAGWKQATKRTTILSDRYEDKRREVAEHLVACGTLRGASKADVLRQLGRFGLPNPKEPNDDPHTWVFYLGPTELGIDDEHLYVRFDDRGRAARFTVGQS